MNKNINKTKEERQEYEKKSGKLQRKKIAEKKQRKMIKTRNRQQRQRQKK